MTTRDPSKRRKRSRALHNQLKRSVEWMYGSEKLILFVEDFNPRVERQRNFISTSAVVPHTTDPTNETYAGNDLVISNSFVHDSKRS